MSTDMKRKGMNEWKREKKMGQEYRDKKIEKQITEYSPSEEEKSKCQK